MCPLRGRPAKGLLSSFPPWIYRQIDQWRPGDAGWGPITIRAELHQLVLQRGCQTKVPSVKAIANYLRAHGRTRSYRRSSTLADTSLDIGQHPHDVWQLDAEGNKPVNGIGTIAQLNIKDTFSKVYVQSYPWLAANKRSHPRRVDYQLALRLAWTEFGMNDALQVDHDSVYYDNTHISPFPTPFHLWLEGLGIQLIFTPKGKPYRQGAAERSHQTLDTQICQGQTFTNWRGLWKRSQQRRFALNNYIGCRMFNDQAPLQYYPNARHSGRSYDIAKEESIFDQDRVYRYLAKLGTWQRKFNSNRSVQLGGQKYFIRQAQPEQECNIYFHAPSAELIFQYPDDKNEIARKKIKGLDWKTLSKGIEQHRQKHRPIFEPDL